MNNNRLSLLPNLLTTLNLFAGCLAIIFAVDDALILAAYKDVLGFGPFGLSILFILLAMVFDMADGFVARITKTDSRFGIEYDSLADLISFGVAPAVIMYLSVLRTNGKWGIYFAAIYIVFGALRLARFNIKATDNPDKKYFQGMPIPAAAGVLVSYVFFFRSVEWYYSESPVLIGQKLTNWYVINVAYIHRWAIPALMVILAGLMVSNFKYPALKYYITKERMPFIIVAGAIAVGPILAMKPYVAIFGMTTFYMFIGIIITIVQGLKQGKSRRKAVKERNV